MLWTNIRPHLPELDHIAGQVRWDACRKFPVFITLLRHSLFKAPHYLLSLTVAMQIPSKQTGYAFDHTFRGLLDDMNAVQVKEAELRKWFQSREKHHQERRAIEEKARQMFEANAEQTPKHARSPPVSVSSQASSAQPSPTNRSGGGGAKTPTSSRLVAVDHADEEELDKEAIQKQKEEARQQRRLDAKRQTPLEIDAENIERLQGEIQGLIMQFSSGVFALMKDPQVSCFS